jgi:DNA-3-methyladenine glycosylase I
MAGKKQRCGWCGDDDLYVDYHDRQWGVPLHDDRELFEMLLLEGAQAGLSWITILRKREAYRKAFAGFDPARVARFDARKVARLLEDPGIVRNRLKVASAVTNARVFRAIQKEHGTFDAYIWSFIGGKPRINRFRRLADVPAKTPEAETMSRDLKKRGMKFVGPTICYAFMQSIGMVNDHTTDCFRHRELK